MKLCYDKEGTERSKQLHLSQVDPSCERVGYMQQNHYLTPGELSVQKSESTRNFPTTN